MQAHRCAQQRTVNDGADGARACGLRLACQPCGIRQAVVAVAVTQVMYSRAHGLNGMPALVTQLICTVYVFRFGQSCFSDFSYSGPQVQQCDQGDQGKARHCDKLPVCTCVAMSKG